MAKGGAFIFAFHRGTGTYLAQLRSKAVSNPLHWNIPGGGLEEGESPVMGACREFFEETLVHCRPRDISPVLTDAEDRHFFVWDCPKQYLVPADSDEADAPESERHEWLPLGTLPDPATPWFAAVHSALVDHVRGLL